MQLLAACRDIFDSTGEAFLQTDSLPHRPGRPLKPWHRWNNGECVGQEDAHDRIEQPGRLSNPIAQCRAVEFEPLAGIDLALSIERKMVAIFRHQQMRQRGRCGATARRRHRRCRSLGDGVARTCRQTSAARDE